MGDLPGAIILINNDQSLNVQAALVQQLLITEVITGPEFNNRVAADPNYPSTIHQNKIRLMVLDSFRNVTNRNLYDLVFFVKEGIASLEQNKFGPHGQSYPISGLYFHRFLSIVRP